MIKGSRPESALFSSAILDFVEKRLHKILRRAYEDNWDDLTLAYAMTIHRAQGSQWPIVIAPIMSCNRSMLGRQILYTLYTRAREATVLYGTSESIQYAIDNIYSTKRNTWLRERLQQA